MAGRHKRFSVIVNDAAVGGTCLVGGAMHALHAELRCDGVEAATQIVARSHEVPEGGDEGCAV